MKLWREKRVPESQWEERGGADRCGCLVVMELRRAGTIFKYRNENMQDCC